MDPQNPRSHDTFDDGARIAEEYRGRLTPSLTPSGPGGPRRRRIGLSVPAAIGALLLVGTLTFGATVLLPGAARPSIIPDETDPPVAVVTASPTAAQTVAATQQPSDDPTVAPSDDPTEEPPADPSAAPTDKTGTQPTADPTAKATPKPTPKATPKPTPKPTTGPVGLGNLVATKGSDGCYTFSWQGYHGREFSYWKLVHGDWGTSPYYPAFPYWAVLDPGTTSWHGCLDPGDYAVRVQAIYYPNGDAKAAAQTNILHLVVSGNAPTPGPTVNLGNLTATKKSDGCYTFSWKGFSGVDFNYWKLVHGPAGSSPYYPAFPYWAVLDPSVTSWTGCLEPGDYAVRVQAIYYPNGDAKAAAQTNILHLVVPAAPSPTPKPTPSPLSAHATVGADGVQVSWGAYTGEGFEYYKVVRSESNTFPTYPENAGTTLVAAISGQGTTAWTDCDVQAGHTYYYRVLVVNFEGGTNVMAKSAVLKVVVPADPA